MSKYVTEFNQQGKSLLNIDLVCKNWNKTFVIYTWINNIEEKYTFVINGKRKNTVLIQTEISKEQANDIVSRLNLHHVKDSLFNSAGAYRSKEFIDSEIERIIKIKKEKEEELSFIINTLYQYERSI